MSLPAPPSDPFTSPSPIAPGSAWKLRYGLVFAGQSLSLLGSALTQFVLLWWITDTTGDITALASAGIAALLPQALLSPLGGTLADRHSRRVLMICADLVSALCMVVLIALFLSGSVVLWQVYTMLAIRSAMQAFQAPAAAASVAMLVPPGFLPRAVGLNQTVQAMMTVAAAPLGALAISVMPMGWALGIDVATALLGIVPLLLFRIPQPRLAPEQRTGMWREFRDGLAVVTSNPGLLRLYLLLGAVVLVVMPSFTLVPLLVKEYFGGGAPQVGIMEAMAGVGMIAGGLFVTAMAPRRRIDWLLTGFAASCAALALTALAPPTLFWVAVFWWAVSGAAFIAGNTPLTTLLQATIPNHLQGRVLALLNMVMALAAPVGLLLATPLGDALGIRWLFVVMGVLGTLVSLAGYLAPSLRALDAADRHTGHLGVK